ncbi:MAG: PepSY-associated TM helix domain-containing protein [Lautropia sp.]|nr:PepSY-associated TM helix domain-containing protein [Lautropia sp.]
MKQSPSQTAASGHGATTIRKPAPKARGIRQTMSDLHIWTGLLVGWLLYAIFLTGSVSYFKDEISQWAQPETAIVPAREAPDTTRPTPPSNTEAAQTQGTAGDAGSRWQPHWDDMPAIAQRTVDALQTRLAPTAGSWAITLPATRHPNVTVSWRPPVKPGERPQRRQQRATLDPQRAEPIKVRDSSGGDFFYRFHYNLHYLPVLWARWVVGFCAMFMLVAIISGIITHKKIFADFFTFRWGKGQRSWLDAHNGLAVLGLPFHLMITYTGLVTMMLMYMPWGAETAFPTPPQQTALRAELSSFRPPAPPSAEQAPLTPVADLVRQAQARWGEAHVERITIDNPGRANATITLRRGDGERVSESPRYLVFDGVSGQLLAEKDTVGQAAETRGVLLALHTGRFADDWIRWFYLILGLGGTAMIGTGLVLWTVKRRAKLPDPAQPYLGFRLVERLNIATIAGLPVAMAAFLWGTRLLPIDMAGRAGREVDLFFFIWALMAIHACLRPPKRAWVEQWALAALLLALMPVLNALTSDHGLPASLLAGNWVFAGFDLAMLLLAALTASLAWRTARHQPRLPAARNTKGAKAAKAAKGNNGDKGRTELTSRSVAPSSTTTQPIKTPTAQSPQAPSANTRLLGRQDQQAAHTAAAACQQPATANIQP